MPYGVKDLFDVTGLPTTAGSALYADAPPATDDAEAVKRLRKAGAVLNLASGTPRRVGDVLTALLELAGVEAEVETDAARLRPSDISTATGDARRAHDVLGWRPAIPWERTLADVLADWSGRL